MQVFEVKCGGTSQGLMSETEAREFYEKNSRSPLKREMYSITNGIKTLVMGMSVRGRGFPIGKTANLLGA